MKKKKSVNPKISQSAQLQKKKQRKKAIQISLIVIVVIIASVGIYLSINIFKEIEDFSKEKLLSKEASVQISNETGKEYYSYASDGARKNVSYDDIPQVMIDAVVAAEDSRFFEHNGFDLPRIVKALMGNIIAGGITGGGSTITQQVIKKSYYPKEEQTIERKLGEVILSIEATSQTTKEEILELYLNKIYFGYGNKAIGIYAASKYYFDKEVQNLTLPEAALLAGALNSPNNYDPFRNLKLAQKRRNVILDLMELHGYITEEECEKTKAIPVENTLKYNPINSSGKYQAYADMVTREVKEKTGYDPDETPMKIYTYLNEDLQSQLDDIANGKSYKFIDDDVQTGAVVQETKNGRVIGVISSRNYEPLGITNAYTGDKKKVDSYGQPHQPGSSLKPILAYAAAFEFLDWSTAHYVHDIPYSSGSWHPKNYNGKLHGDISIENALSNSWNLAAINTFKEVFDKIGEDGVFKYLEGFGFDMSSEREIGLVSTIGGWDHGVTPGEEAAAYAAISNGGTYIEPHTVAKIELMATGEVINIDQDLNNQKSQAISKESAFMIRDVMTNYVKSSSNYSQLNMGLQIGAKTGTSNWPSDSNIPAALRGKSKDSWMSAYSPDYSWSVWVGYPDKVAREKKKAMHGRDSKNISALIAKYVHKGTLKNTYPSQPSGVVKSTCISGIYPYVKPGSGVPKNRIVSGYFKKDNTPSGSASGANLNQLNTFDAVFVNGKIQVSFSKYDPESMTKENPTPTKKYGSVTLPYLGDLNQIYGKVVYVAEVKDSTGNIVHTEKLSSPTAQLKFTPTVGTYTVTGYYAFENGDGTSNKIEKTLSVEGQFGASYSRVSLTSDQLILRINIPAGNIVEIAIDNGQSQMITKTSNVTFSNLVPNQQYTISFIEKTSDGKTQNLDPYTFTVPSENTNPTETNH